MKLPLSIASLLIAVALWSCGSAKHAEQYSAIEITGNSSDSLMAKELSQLGVAPDESYRWNHHFVVFAAQEKVEKVATWAKERYSIKRFDTPFYNFNREKVSGEKPAKEWTHILLSANLVADTVKQKEYMEYHRTQFEKWPELSKGFSNAQFQQLLVFRNGRQLLLVISIPKGKSLDELNPKTTENNPRVEEWNKIMANYQVGLDDAPQGAVWVMFGSIKN